MRIIVTGETGVIQRRVVPLLIAADHSVTAIMRKGSHRSSFLPSDCSTVAASPFNAEELTEVFTDQEAVINLATRIPQSPLSMITPCGWRENDRIRGEGARNVSADASKEAYRRSSKNLLRTPIPHPVTIGSMRRCRSNLRQTAGRCWMRRQRLGGCGARRSRGRPTVRGILWTRCKSMPHDGLGRAAWLVCIAGQTKRLCIVSVSR
jgi:hypothetical protein